MQVEIVVLEISTEISTSSRLPFPGRAGLGGLPWSVAARTVTWGCSPSSSSSRARPAGACSLLSLPVCRAAAALPLLRRLMAFQNFVPPEAFPPLLGKVLPPPLQKFWFGCWVYSRRCVCRLHARGLPSFTSLCSLVSVKIGVDQVFRKSWTDSFLNVSSSMFILHLNSTLLLKNYLYWMLIFFSPSGRSACFTVKPYV